jgi:ABC-type dipeptide/oligopeptide/nickel transport system permease subunit
MGEVGKLIAGLVGVVVGMLAGFGALTLVMQRTGGALFDTPALGLLVAVGLVGGGGTLLGYVALWIVGAIEKRRKKARHAAKKKGRGRK